MIFLYPKVNARKWNKGCPVITANGFNITYLLHQSYYNKTNFTVKTYMLYLVKIGTFRVFLFLCTRYPWASLWHCQTRLFLVLMHILADIFPHQCKSLVVLGVLDSLSTRLCIVAKSFQSSFHVEYLGIVEIFEKSNEKVSRLRNLNSIFICSSQFFT